MEEEANEKEFKAHMDGLADSQSRSGKSVIMTPDKYNAIVQYLKDPDVVPESSGAPWKNGWPVNGHIPYWIKSRGFRLQSFPEEGLADVLVASGKAKDSTSDSPSGQALRVIHSQELYNIVKQVHSIRFQHGGYKRVLTYMQANYFGVTRGYVQEFCSLCPVCRPHKRRPANAFPLDVVNQMLGQSSSHHAGILSTQGPALKPRPSSWINSEEVIELDESSGSDEDDSLPVFPSVSMSLTYARGGDLKTTPFQGKRGTGRVPHHGSRDKTATGQEIINLDNFRGNSNEEQDLEFVPIEEKEKSMTGTPQKRAQNNRTRTVVQGDSVYIVTVNEDSDPEEETLCQKSNEKNGVFTEVACVITSTKSMAEESDIPDFESSLNPECSVYSPASSLTENTELEEVGCYDQQHHSETAHDKHSLSSIQSQDTSVDRKHNVSGSCTIPEKSDCNPDLIQVSLDPASIKLERIDDSAEDTLLECPTSKDLHTECGNSNGNLSHNPFQDFTPTPDLGKRMVACKDRNKRMRDHCCSTAEQNLSGVVVKSEPESADEREQNSDTVLKETRGLECQVKYASHTHMADGRCWLQGPQPRKKLKTDEAHQVQHHRTESSSRFFQHLHVDIIDMTHCPHDTFRYICHVTDHVSKLHVLFPLKQASAYDVAPMLDQRVLTYYGMPIFLHSNQGYEFVAELITALIQTVEGGVACANGELEVRAGEGRGRGTNVVEELIAMLKVERCSSSADREHVPWLSWLPRIMRSLNRDWYASLRSNAIAANSR